MAIKRITIIVPKDCLEDFEHCLRSAGVPGMTIDNVKGFGEHANFFSSDLLRSNARIEVYIGEDRCSEICRNLCAFAGEVGASTGILTVEPVDRLIDLCSGRELSLGGLPETESFEDAP